MINASPKKQATDAYECIFKAKIDFKKPSSPETFGSNSTCDIEAKCVSK